MPYHLSKRSQKRLEGVHPDLVRVVKRAIEITDIDFGVLEGVRSTKRQEALVKAGKSRTMNSRHLTGHAVDLVAYLGGKVCWSFRLYKKIAEAMKQAAKEQRVLIEWGGDWKSFKDGCHFQLSWAFYRANEKGASQ